MDCINTGIPGWMSAAELAWLHYQAMQHDSAVEVGCWKGRSTYALLTGCRGPVFAVDHFRGSPSELGTNHREALTTDIHAAFVANVGWFPNLRVLRTSSAGAAQVFTDERMTAGMVFIDGEHVEKAVLEDIGMWKPLCEHVLCGHDRDIASVETALAGSGIKWHAGPGSLWYATKGEDF
jgi:hypothetical protein